MRFFLRIPVALLIGGMCGLVALFLSAHARLMGAGIPVGLLTLVAGAIAVARLAVTHRERILLSLAYTASAGGPALAMALYVYLWVFGRSGNPGDVDELGLLFITGVGGAILTLVAGCACTVICIIFARRKRWLTGACRHCGYDLCATPNRCPECGHQRTSPLNSAL